MRAALIAAILGALACGGAGPEPATGSEVGARESVHGSRESASEVGARESESESEVGSRESASESASESESESESEVGSRESASDGDCPAEVPAEMACVHGGTFVRGDDDDPVAAPAEAVTVSTFLMDRREVSNADYAECVAAEVCEPAFPFRGFGAPELPAVAMRWEDARAYCAWKGKRLPTEAEWERAARGPENTRWPHGNERAGCARVHVRDGRGHGCGTELTRAVGTLPPGHWGLHDMAGNVDEWVQDWFSECYRGCPGECGDACLGTDPRGPCDGAAECPTRNRRVVRGGSWWWGEHFATGTRRRGKPPANGAHHRYGFRCARDA